MINRLHISNYALIENLTLEPGRGLTVITGETGAGKSILLGALSLISGNRADSAVLSDKKKKCIVEAVFDLKGYNLEAFFKNYDLDQEVQTIIRREISPEGKSRAFINDTPVTLAILKELGEQLIDIHSQHETLTLNNSAFQLQVVDTLAASNKVLSKYEKLYQEFQSALKSLKILKEQEALMNKESDFNTYLYNELNEAVLTNNEQEQLEEELRKLEHATDIKDSLASVYQLLNGENTSLISGVHSTITGLNHIISYLPSVSDLATRLKSIHIELKDILSEISSLDDNVHLNPERLEIVNERLDLIYRLHKKHKTQTLTELLDLKELLKSKITNSENITGEILKLEKSKADLIMKLKAMADEIGFIRRKKIPEIEVRLQKMLQSLGMKNARVEISIESLPENEFGKSGCDKIEFMFSANPGSTPRPLNKVASGGELSRLMLCIKSLMAKQEGLPTLVFDEIDSGVSGDVAHKIGLLIREIADDRQVIVITHLPQMAAQGNDHLRVHKMISGGKTHTMVHKLTSEERVEEIAKMLSGEELTEAAIANAKTLLHN